MKFEFDSEIKQLEGKIKWPVFYFPYDTTEYFGKKGNIPVIITVDGYEFEHTLLPSKNGHYLVYNEFIKRAVNKNFGDVLHCTLEIDTKIRELKIPEYIKNYLKENDVFDIYLKQPDYLKREQINFIEVAKKDETKLNRLKKLTNMLGEKL